MKGGGIGGGKGVEGMGGGRRKGERTRESRRIQLPTPYCIQMYIELKASSSHINHTRYMRYPRKGKGRGRGGEEEREGRRKGRGGGRGGGERGGGGRGGEEKEEEEGEEEGERNDEGK